MRNHFSKGTVAVRLRSSVWRVSPMLRLPRRVLSPRRSPSQQRCGQSDLHFHSTGNRRSRPAAEVWRRVGKFCDISEWFRIPCTITSGKDGEFGAVRSVAGEVSWRKPNFSYTYTQKP